MVCLPIADFLGEVPWVGLEGFLLSTHIVIKFFLTVKTFVVESTNIKKGFGVLFTILSEAILRTLLVFYDSLDFFWFWGPYPPTSPDLSCVSFWVVDHDFLGGLSVRM